MAIRIDKENKIFYLETPNTSYIIGIYKDKYPLHMYYGKKIKTMPRIENMMRIGWRGFFGREEIDGELICPEFLPQEYPTYGAPDLRNPAFHAIYPDGSCIGDFRYDGYMVEQGKPKLSGLPATYVEHEDEADTLYIYLKDSVTGVRIALCYTAFNTVDAIARSVRIENGGNAEVDVRSALSMSVDIEGADFEFMHLDGSWARERHVVKTALTTGNFGIDSKRGASGHAQNPFVALLGKDANEMQGEVYGFNLVYSGNFTAQVYVDEMDYSRVQLGINPFNFSWKLAPGESFQTPECVMVYSDAGIGKMSRTFHSLYRTRLVRGKYRDIERPVLLNNWEATYFDFTEAQILEIAKKAKSVGVELMVLDDGWFGARNNSKCGLGDWFVNTQKLPDGIVGLAKKIEAMGMKFGLWFEPEMISPDSDLYRAHPDWCIHVPGRGRSVARNQCVLDLTRAQVRDYVLSFMRKHLTEAAISYVKWDMNRNITEPYSVSLAPEKQGEFSHRYMLAVYEILEKLTTEFPDVLFEGCSGGGGRFDAGMLHYFPQYWTSDDSDAIERLYIQHGTSMVYPFSTMGAHVSAVPNHQVGRVTPIETRGDVALPGQFGFELDLNKLTDEEIESVKAQIVRYKKLGAILHQGDLYRLASPFEERHCAWAFESEDKNTIVLIQCTVTGRPHSNTYRLKLPMAQTDAVYTADDGTVYHGDYLANCGLQFVDSKDFVSKVMVFEKQ